MPVSVIVGGQYGSEGKGKIAHIWARDKDCSAAVRVGGPNSGHTVVALDGTPVILRHLPTAALEDGPALILPPGAYIDPEVLLAEIESLGVSTNRVIVDPFAAVITSADRDRELLAGLPNRIGSTGSGTGSCVARRVARDGTLVRAQDSPELRPFLADTLQVLRQFLNDGRRVILEGTQGYGLSPLHGSYGDFSTSRDTTAAAFVAEAGLSPLDVDEIVLVVRTFPIRVAGNSGPLKEEVTWNYVGSLTGRSDIVERTSVTNRVRRVGCFDSKIVRRAVKANRPNYLVLNHLDYLARLDEPEGRSLALAFVRAVEEEMGMAVNLVGTGPATVMSVEELALSAVAPAVPSLSIGCTI